MRTNRNAVLAAAVAATLAAVGATPALAATWDGGSGTWQVGVGNWDGGGNWVDNNPATLPLGGSGTLTLGGPINATTITFDDNNYTIDLNGNNLTAANVTTTANVTTSSLVFTSQPAATITLDSQQNTSRFLYTGAGLNVVYNGAPSNALELVNQHTYGGSLSLNPSIGTVFTVRGNNSFGASGNTVNANANTIFQFDGNTALNTTIAHNINLASGSKLSVTNAKSAIVTGSISGSLLYQVATSAAGGVPAHGANQGMLVLAGSNNFSGAVTGTANGFSLVLANDNAINGATMVVGNSSSPWTLGFMGDSGGSTDITSAIDVRTGTGAAPARGEGNVHNYSGNNSFAGNIVAWDPAANGGLGGVAGIYKVFGAEPGTSLTLKGKYMSGRGFQKFGSGTLVLTNQNAYGTSNGTSLNDTYVGAGTLKLDFSQATWETSPGVQTNIINNGLTTTTAANGVSELSLLGGTLEVIGKNGYADTQNFKNYNGASTGLTNAFNIKAGTSKVIATQNDATSLTINLGKLFTSNRLNGGTVDFTLPTAGSIVLPAPVATNAVGTNNTILTSNGAAFATVGKTDWAALDAAGNRTIVAGSSLGGFYTANGANSLSGNANMSGGTDTQLLADATTTSLRFADNTAARSVDVNGNILTTGGILVSSGVGNNATSIIGGSLRGAVGTTASLQDLVVMQHNTGAALTIGSKIVNNGTATSLTKSGAGTLVLTADNSTANGGYTGTTYLNEGLLKLDSANALGDGLLQIDGGVLGLTSNFTRVLGSAAGNVRFTGSGGFAAYGGTLDVTFKDTSNANITFTWGGDTNSTSNHNIRTGEILTFGASDATGTVNLVNNLSLGASLTAPFQRTIEVINSTSVGTEARISGNISSGSGIDKIGTGTLEIAGTANSFSGPVNIFAGGVILSGTTTSTLRPPINVFSGATFQQTGTSTHSGLLDVKGGGSAEIGGIMSTTGADAATVAGTLTLTGVGKIVGTTTVNNGGILRGSSTPVTGRSLATVIVNSGGTVSPGFSPGILNTGNISLTSGAIYTAELEGATAGNGAGFHDQLNVAGTVNLNSDAGSGSNLAASLSYIPTLGDELFILLNNATDAIVGEFAGLGEGDTLDLTSTIDSQLYRFAISYVANGDAGTTGNDVSLTNVAVPEPTSVALLALGGLAIAGRRRRARR